MLQDGQVIQLGSHVTLLYRVTSDEAVGALDTLLTGPNELLASEEQDTNVLDPAIVANYDRDNLPSTTDGPFVADVDDHERNKVYDSGPLDADEDFPRSPLTDRGPLTEESLDIRAAVEQQIEDVDHKAGLDKPADPFEAGWLPPFEASSEDTHQSQPIDAEIPRAMAAEPLAGGRSASYLHDADAPPSSGYHFEDGAMDGEPQSNNRRNLIIIGVIVSVLLLCCCCLFGIGLAILIQEGIIEDILNEFALGPITHFVWV